MTVWGSVQTRRMVFARRPGEVISLEVNESSNSSSEKIPVRMLLSGQTKAPLMVYFAGLFTGVDDPFMLRSMLLYSQLGYHVVGLPNPWSLDYLAAPSRLNPGSIESEARTMLLLIERSVQKIGRGRISRVEVVGESYGGFLAVVSAALQAESRSRRAQEAAVHVDRFTVFGTPLDLAESRQQLDDSIARALPGYAAQCEGWWPRILSIASFFWSKRQSELSAQAAQCREGLLTILGFQDRLVETALKLNEIEKAKNAPPEGSDQFESWKRALTFRSFGERFTPLNSRLSSDHGKLDFWVSRALRAGSLDRVRILVAKDDPIHSPGSAERPFWKRLSGRNFLALNWGGHLGFMMDPAFANFLRAIF